MNLNVDFGLLIKKYIYYNLITIHVINTALSLWCKTNYFDTFCDSLYSLNNAENFSRPIFASLSNELQFCLTESGWYYQHSKKHGHILVLILIPFCVVVVVFSPPQKNCGSEPKDPVIPKAWRPHPYVSMTTT